MIQLKKIINHKNIKILFCLGLCILIAFVLIKFRTLCTKGVKDAIELCIQTIIPSLFPFLVLSSFATESGTISFLGKKTDKVFRKVFKASGHAGIILLFSLFSGFPVGCSLASSLYSGHKISQNEAKRLALSCVNAGPAFVITAVGSMMLYSFKAGLLIFLSLSLSSVVIFFLAGFILSDEEKIKTEETAIPVISQSLVSSVYNASKSMLIICSWIIIFSCFLNILYFQKPGVHFSVFFNSVFEVTSGCRSLAPDCNPIIIAAVIGWGGLCVHCQVFPYILKIGLKAKYFFCSRLLNAMLSAFFCNLAFKIFPCEISVFSTGVQPTLKTFAVSIPVTAGLLLMCVIFVLDLDAHKKIC